MALICRNLWSWCCYHFVINSAWRLKVGTGTRVNVTSPLGDALKFVSPGSMTFEINGEHRALEEVKAEPKV